MSGLPTRHCRHCWGNCAGNCMLPGLDVCIHDVHRGPRLPLSARLRAVRGRRFWRRLLFGIHAH
jgi:hypothetical protein